MKTNTLAKQDSQELFFLRYINVFNIFALIIILATLRILVSQWYLFAWLPAVSVIALYFSIKYSNRLFYLFIFLLPFSAYTKLLENYKFLTATKLLGILLVLSIFFKTISNHSSLRKKSFLWNYLGIFLVIAVFSTIFSEYPISSIDYLRKLITAFLIFYFTLYFFNADDITLKLHKVIVISISIATFLSIIGYVFHLSSLTIGHSDSELTRATGANKNPNFLASMAVICFPFISHYLFSSQSGLMKIFWLGLFVINITSVIFSYSRSGGLVAAATLLLILYYYYRFLNPKKIGFVVIALFMALGVFAIATPASYWDRIQSITETKTDNSLGRRFSYLEVAQDQFLKKPIFGSGLGTFKNHYQDSIYAIEFGKEGKTNKRAAHNAYIEILIGTGLIGLSCYLALVFFTLKTFRKIRLAFLNAGQLELSSLTNAYCIAFVSLLGFSFFASNFYIEYYWIFFASVQILFDLSKTTIKTEEMA